MRIYLLLLFPILFMGCNQHKIDKVNPYYSLASLEQLFIYHLYTETKCISWHEITVKNEICMVSVPNYVEELDIYSLNFNLNVDSSEDLSFFKNATEETRNKILKDDVNNVIYSFHSLIKTFELPLLSQSQNIRIRKRILDRMVVLINFNYMGNYEYDYYMGDYDGRSKKITITNKTKEVRAI